MKKLILLLLSSAAFAQTFTVSGHVVDPTNSVPSQTTVTFKLVNTGTQQCKVSGTGLIVPNQIAFTPNSVTGVISGTLYRNDFIVCGNQSLTQWAYTINQSGTIMPTCVLAQVATTAVNLDNTVCSNTTPVVSPPTGDTTYCRLDGSNCGITGGFSVAGGSTLHAVSASSATVTGALSAQSLNGVLWIGTGTGQYSSLAACYAAIPSSGGTCVVSPNWSETLAANLVLSKNNAGFVFAGPATITMNSFQVTKPGGVNGAFIKVYSGGLSEVPVGVDWLYAGSGYAFDLGDASTTTGGLELSGQSACLGASALGAFRIRQTIQYELNNLDAVYCPGSGANTEVAFVLDGGTAFTGDGSARHLHSFGIQTGLRLLNSANFNIILDSNFGAFPASGVGVDIQSGNGNIIQVDAESASTGVNIANSSNNFGNRIFLYGQGNTNDFVIGAGASGNYLDNVGAFSTGQVTVSGTGTNNTIYNPFKWAVDQSGNVTTSGSYRAIEAAAPSGVANQDILYPDSSAHRWKMNNNNGGADVVVGAATTDTLTHKTINSPTISRVTGGSVSNSCAVTGAGASGACSVNTPCDDSYCILRITAAGAGLAASGTITFTLSASLGSSFTQCQFSPSNTAGGAWNARATVFQSNISQTAPIGSWDNNASALTATTWDIAVSCIGH